MVGVGAGQMSRVDSVHIASAKPATESMAACWRRMPSSLSATTSMRRPGGVTAVVQPGGSLRDQDSIAACDEHNLAMVFTGIRHFRH